MLILDADCGSPDSAPNVDHADWSLKVDVSVSDECREREVEDQRRRSLWLPRWDSSFEVLGTYCVYLYPKSACQGQADKIPFILSGKSPVSFHMMGERALMPTEDYGQCITYDASDDADPGYVSYSFGFVSTPK